MSTSELKVECQNSFTNDEEKDYYVSRINVKFEFSIAKLRITIVSA